MNQETIISIEETCGGKPQVVHIYCPFQELYISTTVERGGEVGGVITPGLGPRRGPQKIQSMKIYHIL